MPLFGRKDKDANKTKLEYKLYLAREDPEPIFDLSDCALKCVPQGIYSLCKVFRKEVLCLQDNHLTSLSGGGKLEDLCFIHRLYIQSNSLSKLPEEIGCLTNLIILNVSNNELKKLPATIGQLKKLNVLDVSNNKLSILPNELGDLSHLKTLDVRGNKYMQTLPTSLCKCTFLSQLLIDVENLIYPSVDICEKGTTAVLQFLSEECGLEYVPHNGTGKGQFEAVEHDTNDGEEFLQAKILQLERLKEQKRIERQALEKEIEEQQEKELKLQSDTNLNKKKLLDDLLAQQSKLEDEILRVQQTRETEKLHLLHQLQEAETVTDQMISQLLSLTANDESVGQLPQLIERDRLLQEQELSARQREYQQLRQREILSAMEKMLTEEERHEKLIREYEESRAKTARQLLDQETERNSWLSNIKFGSENLADKLRHNAELQRAAVAALLERGDERSRTLRQQLELVSQQLADLTSLELKQNRLRVARHMAELSEKRKALSSVLVELMEWQIARRQQLLFKVNEMEQQRLSLQKDSCADFWLVQYQRLLDCQPAYFADAERCLDPTLGRHLVAAGVVRYLPFLTNWLRDGHQLSQLSDSDLSQVGIKSSEDRVSILKAVMLYLEEKERRTKGEAEPSAPPLTEGQSECVICMEHQCAVVFVPCGHLCCCAVCSDAVSSCPLCRGHIERRVRALLA